MSGIVGIQGKDENNIVNNMLSKIKYRGKNNGIYHFMDDLTLGIISNDPLPKAEDILDEHSFLLSSIPNTTKISFNGQNLSIKRGKYGMIPLYYVFLKNDKIAFASEVKALIGLNLKINELWPGYSLENSELRRYYELKKEVPLKQDKDEISKFLREALINAIKIRLSDKKTGAWLSGGLDSSGISALVKPFVKELHTFSVGFRDAPDLAYAKNVADFIKSHHHEMIVSFEDIIRILPDVIYHLESFDTFLVRSSIMNYLVAQLASEYVEEVFSGECGNELFAGYEYIKSLPKENIEDELIEITNRLHNTALQRVDRCSSAFGTTAHLPFLDEDVVELAIRIPVNYKIYENYEKWILRLALADDLPNEVLIRTNLKFWEGTGIEQYFYSYAEGLIPGSDFEKEKNIKCGWQLNSKEELMYYRIFKEHFGELNNLDWMGRTKQILMSNE